MLSDNDAYLGETLSPTIINSLPIQLFRKRQREQATQEEAPEKRRKLAQRTLDSAVIKQRVGLQTTRRARQEKEKEKDIEEREEGEYDSASSDRETIDISSMDMSLMDFNWDDHYLPGLGHAQPTRLQQPTTTTSTSTTTTMTSTPTPATPAAIPPPTAEQSNVQQLELKRKLPVIQLKEIDEAQRMAAVRAVQKWGIAINMSAMRYDETMRVLSMPLIREKHMEIWESKKHEWTGPGTVPEKHVAVVKKGAKGYLILYGLPDPIDYLEKQDLEPMFYEIGKMDLFHNELTQVEFFDDIAPYFGRHKLILPTPEDANFVREAGRGFLFEGFTQIMIRDWINDNEPSFVAYLSNLPPLSDLKELQVDLEATTGAKFKKIEFPDQLVEGTYAFAHLASEEDLQKLLSFKDKISTEAGILCIRRKQTQAEREREDKRREEERKKIEDARVQREARRKNREETRNKKKADKQASKERAIKRRNDRKNGNLPQ